MTLLEDLDQIQRELCDVATGLGAFSNAETVFRKAPRLVRLCTGGVRDAARDLPDNPTRALVSAAVDAAIGRRLSGVDADSCRVFLLTDAAMSLPYDGESIGQVADTVRMRQGERKSLAMKATGTNPLPGTAGPAIRLLAWELAYEIVSPTTASAADLLRRIAGTARQHYSVPGLEFTELGRAVLDSRRRCVGAAKLRLTVAPRVVSASVAADPATGMVVDFTEQLEFEGTFDDQGEYSIVISTAHGAQESWRRMHDCPTVYFMSRDDLMTDLVVRAESNPDETFEISYWPADQDQTTWTPIPVTRNVDLEKRLFEAAASASPSVAGLEPSQILALTCRASFPREDRQRLRKTVRLQFPIEDGAIRWRADYPMYLTDIEIVRSAMGESGYVVRPFWYLAGGRVSPSPREQVTSPSETITREPMRWVLRDHGIALRWDAPPPRDAIEIGQ